jgi:histidine decarboxylase
MSDKDQKQNETVTPLVQAPCPSVPDNPIDCSQFKLSPSGLSPEQRQQAFEQLKSYQTLQKKRFLGYQVNNELDYEDELKQYLNFHINNIGDPFQQGNLTTNSKWMETAVLDYYASLWEARWPHDPQDGDSYWGYILTMGSSEGNLYGLWNARDYLAGKILLIDEPQSTKSTQQHSTGGQDSSVPRYGMYYQAKFQFPEGTSDDFKNNAYTPIAFYSEDTHYSIIKAVRVLGIKTFYEVGTEKFPNDNPLSPGNPWPQEVPSEESGSINIEALAKLVEFFASHGYPILVNLNYGTTFKGAYDDVEKAGERLKPIFENYNLWKRKVYYDPEDPTKYDCRNGFWFHVDGALGASYMPFIEMAYNQKKIEKKGPVFDFRLEFVHSIVTSGHKWPGAPWPCGIYMSKTKLQLSPPSKPEYIGALDTTFAGSRNGFSAIIWWDRLAKTSYEKEIDKAISAQEVAKYAYEKLKELEEELKQDLWVERTPLALTIRFKRPDEDIVAKYSLSTETLNNRHYAHIFTMPHVTLELIDQFITELKQPNAFPEQSAVNVEPPSEVFFFTALKQLVHVPQSGRGFK